MTTVFVHPSFVRASKLSEPLRSHFPKSSDEALAFEPLIRHRALDMCVLVVARTRIECAWAAFVGAVDGLNHFDERDNILDHGAKLDEPIARILFPEFAEVPYAS